MKRETGAGHVGEGSVGASLGHGRALEDDVSAAAAARGIGHRQQYTLPRHPIAYLRPRAQSRRKRPTFASKFSANKNATSTQSRGVRFFHIIRRFDSKESASWRLRLRILDRWAQGEEQGKGVMVDRWIPCISMHLTATTGTEVNELRCYLASRIKSGQVSEHATFFNQFVLQADLRV